ncbi:hypothetical protein [Streptomyces sp. AB3(2024)]|uniref:hypothetical protein n=1 Tax=Streptomyces sp. AB3(2024) TaxID=3317321 RepID=UPI0035A2D396
MTTTVTRHRRRVGRTAAALCVLMTVLAAVRSYKALAGCLGRPLPAAPVRAGAPVAGSVVLAREGDDHSMFLVPQCVRKAANLCLTTRVVPAPGTT